MKKNRNIRIVEETPHDARQVTSRYSAGNDPGTMSFAEFVEHLDEQAEIRRPLKNRIRDLSRRVLSIVSFRLFNSIIN